jgi:hypothetical protein
VKDSPQPHLVRSKVREKVRGFLPLYHALLLRMCCVVASSVLLGRPTRFRTRKAAPLSLDHPLQLQAAIVVVEVAVAGFGAPVRVLPLHVFPTGAAVKVAETIERDVSDPFEIGHDFASQTCHFQ